MYASHSQLLKRAEELRHRRNVISKQYSSTKVEPLFISYSPCESLPVLQSDTEREKLVEEGADVKQLITTLEVVN